MSTQVHMLKCSPEYFKEVWFGNKLFECRKDDRGFKVGDTLVLQEYLHTNKQYTGAAFEAKIMYVLPGGVHGILPGYSVLSIRVNHALRVHMDKDEFNLEDNKFSHLLNEHD